MMNRDPPVVTNAANIYYGIHGFGAVDQEQE